MAEILTRHSVSFLSHTKQEPMKVDFDKIGEFELLEKELVFDSMLRFRINGQERYQKKVAEFKQKLNEPGNREVEHLKGRFGGSLKMAAKGMAVNLAHALRADWYYTNGQNICSILQTEEGWQVGEFGKIARFKSAISAYYSMSDISLRSLDLQTYELWEQAEAAVCEHLRTLEAIRLPLLEGGEVIVQRMYPNKAWVYLGGAQPKELEVGDYLVKFSEAIEAMIAPDGIRACMKCEHFRFSGMAYDMSGGSKGYCSYFRDQIEKPAHKDTVTHIWNWCRQFQLRSEK